MSGTEAKRGAVILGALAIFVAYALVMSQLSEVSDRFDNVEQSLEAIQLQLDENGRLLADIEFKTQAVEESVLALESRLN